MPDPLKIAFEALKQKLKGCFRLELKDQYRPIETDTLDGRCTTVATWRNRPDIELWLDKSAGSDRLRFWFGFASSSAKKMKNLYDAMPEADVPQRELTEDDWRHLRRGDILHRPVENELTQPFRETYRSWRTFFFGMYDWGGHANPVSLELAAWSAAEFIKKVVNSVNGDGIDEELEGFEGKERRRFFLHREREARSRRQKIDTVLNSTGKLVCEVPRCGFDFEAKYGELGKGYAQVHHRKRLADAPKSGQRVRLKDLAVVCANCHVMIHRGGECRPMDSLIPSRD